MSISAGVGSGVVVGLGGGGGGGAEVGEVRRCQVGRFAGISQ